MFHRGDRVDPEWLAGIELFAGLDPHGIDTAAKLGRRREMGAGERIVDQGRVGDACFVIGTGQASVYIRGEYVNTVGPGSVIGEMALLEHRPRSATVVADTDMVLVEFGIEEFKRFLAANPAANDQILGVLNRRVRDNLSRD